MMEVLAIILLTAGAVILLAALGVVMIAIIFLMEEYRIRREQRTLTKEEWRMRGE